MAPKETPNGVVLTNDICDNGRQKMLIIGKTGTGKSSLCNTICGYNHDTDIFPVSAEAASCTQRTKFADVFFNKDPAMPISLIDTIGFDDPDKDNDAKIIAELVDKLKYHCDHVNLFIIAVNGQNPRLDSSLIGMIKIFEGMFGQEFWKQVVVVFTRMPMDAKTVKKRHNTTKQTDEDLALKYMTEVQKRFKNGHGIKHIFLDACHDKEDQDEVDHFTTGLNLIYNKLKNAPRLATSKVKEVETQTAALKKQITEKEKQREAAELKLVKQMLVMKEKQEEAVKKMKEAVQAADRVKERRFQEELEALRGEVQTMKTQFENKGFKFGKWTTAVAKKLSWKK